MVRGDCRTDGKNGKIASLKLPLHLDKLYFFDLIFYQSYLASLTSYLRVVSINLDPL